MADKSPLFIVNPASGGGRTARRWPGLAAAIEEAGLTAEAVHTEARGHGTELAAQAMKSGRTLLVAVGGDGTTNEVASAVLAAGAGEDVKLATIGMGTGKDVAKCLGVGSPRKAISVIAEGFERPVDAGRVICRDESGESVVRFFLLEASAGWVPEISGSTPKFLKKLGDTAPYLITLAVKLVGPLGREFTLTIDGASFDARYNSISVHNMELWGGDMVAAPGALPDDGLFDVIRWGDLGRLAVLRAVQGQRQGGTHLEMDGVDRHAARTLELDAGKRTIVDLDGETSGYLPARITMLEGALRFLAPERD